MAVHHNQQAGYVSTDSSYPRYRPLADHGTRETPWSFQTTKAKAEPESGTTFTVFCLYWQSQALDAPVTLQELPQPALQPAQGHSRDVKAIQATNIVSPPRQSSKPQESQRLQQAEQTKLIPGNYQTIMVRIATSTATPCT